MSGRAIRSRPPHGELRMPTLDESPSSVEARLSDAAHRRGRAQAVCAPLDEGEWAGLLTSGRKVHCIGAQSSLTGGATPDGGIVATTEQLRGLLADSGDRVRVQPGLSLAALQESLRASGRWFPPVPTYDGAFVGGAVSTDAAGAKTFRHGTTRRWVEGLKVMLADGRVLELRRGELRADEAGRFAVDGQELQLPMHELPSVPKCSAGYRGGAGLDLVDLFIGSEGTLGALLEVELRVATLSHAEMGLLVGLPGESEGLAAVAGLRSIPEVAAIEFIDGRCLALMDEAGVPKEGWLLLVQLELPGDPGAEEVTNQLAGESAGSVAEVAALLERQGGALGEGLVALPRDDEARRRLSAIREAAPVAVFEEVARARAASGEDIVKIGGDPIVPFEQLGELLAAARREAAELGLDLAVWGHVSDGNVHPNVIARSAAEAERGEELLLSLGRKAIELGGSPLAEHGVGRHPLKQRLLAELVGPEALNQMKALKRALDPNGVLAPGVLFGP